VSESAIHVVGIVGGGVIGSGWAARCLARGLEVVAWDPHPEGEQRLRDAVANAWPALSRVGLAPGADPARLRYVDSVEAVAAEAEFIQESAPEREDLKTELLARIDRAAAPEVVIASSSSGLLPSRIQRDCAHPERVAIGHPFNPVYLLPLVEVLGGERTHADTLEAAATFYTAIGMRPLRVRREIEGYLSDRLQEAIWREALHLVNDGIASTEEIDAAITYGPGLRWAFMGPCLTFHLAGGDEGMRHMLRQFGPALKLPWTKLVAPELTDTLIERMVEGTQAQAAGRPVKEIERLRDECLIRIQEILADTWPDAVWPGIGARVTTPYEGRRTRPWQPGETIDAPLVLHRTPVRPQWLDYNGHMSESCYLLVAGDASDALFRYIGIDEAYRSSGASFFTVETHMNNFREAGGNDALVITTQVLDLDPKRLHILHTLRNAATDERIASVEQMLLHVDTTAGHSAPIRPEVMTRLEAIRDAHAALPRPQETGRSIGIRRTGS
jgi:carnitine 3-dehydrogenase